VEWWSNGAKSIADWGLEIRYFWILEFGLGI
jgi:hypothetical protein